MGVHAPSTRRDRRYSVRPGAGRVVIPAFPDHLEKMSAPLKISVAGIAFALDRPLDGLARGSLLKGARVLVGACVLEGDIAIRDVSPTGASVEVGGLFLPAAREVETRLMALLAGIAAMVED